MEDRHARVRAMPFDALARALGIDTSKFKARKGGTEHAGPCLVHRPKKNSTSFSYAQDGKFGCFSCAAKGRGATDLAMAVNGIGFQAAVELLEPYAGIGNRSQSADNRIANTAGSLTAGGAAAPRIATIQEVPSENPPKKFSYEQHYVPSVWLQARHLAPRTCERYGVGQYDNPARQSAYKGRVLIRMQRFSDGARSATWRTTSRRRKVGAPEYAMPPGIHMSLEVFGAWQLKERSPLRIVYLVESPFAVMRFHEMGLPAVSPYGWSFSQQQAEIIGQQALVARRPCAPVSLPVERAEGSRPSDPPERRIPTSDPQQKPQAPRLANVSWKTEA
jgi:hypothetical protein